MALSVSLTQDQTTVGISTPTSYFRLVTVAISYTREGVRNVMMDVAGYLQKPVHPDIRDVTFWRLYEPLPTIEAQQGGDFIAKCYSYLKTLPEFTNSEDV